MTGKFRIGLLLNPVAGLGGKLALKGSDDVDAAVVMSDGTALHTPVRVGEVLDRLASLAPQLEIVVAPEPMGAQLLKGRSFNYQVVGSARPVTSAEDTKRLCRDICANRCRSMWRTQCGDTEDKARATRRRPGSLRRS